VSASSGSARAGAEELQSSGAQELRPCEGEGELRQCAGRRGRTPARHGKAPASSGPAGPWAPASPRQAAAMGDAGARAAGRRPWAMRASKQAGRRGRHGRASRRKWRPRSLSYGAIYCLDLVNAYKGNKNRMRKEYPDSYGLPKTNQRTLEFMPLYYLYP
jgi:hypothetical protein